jgi:hypothetical protein
MTVQTASRTLEEQRREYVRRRFLAMPLAGILTWTAIGIAGATLPRPQAVMAVWFGAGSIFFLGAFFSR